MNSLRTSHVLNALLPDGVQCLEKSAKKLPILGLLLAGLWMAPVVRGDSFFGWACGGKDAQGGILLATTNGVDWFRQGVGQLPDVPLGCVCSAGTGSVWVVGDNLDGYATVYHSPNGGVTWTRQGDVSTLPTNPLHKACAVDEHVVWAVGVNGGVARTMDGGATWTNVSPPAFSTMLQGVTAISAQTAWVSGEEELMAGMAAVFHTTNGGASWVQQTSAAITNANHHLLGLQALDAQRIWAIGGHQTILFSTNGGAQWEVVFKGGIQDGNEICVLDDQRIWAANDAVVTWTTNGGISWGSYNTAEYTMDVSTPDGTHVWASSSGYWGGKIYYSPDSGVTWTSQFENVQYKLPFTLDMRWRSELHTNVHYVDVASTNPVPPYLTWGTASTNLRAAVAVSGDGHTIWVNDGHYLLDGPIRLTNAIRVEGVHNPAATRVDGNYPAFTNRCFLITHTSACLVNLTITNGYAQGATLAEFQGGGVLALVDGGIVSNCVITGNRAKEGGGISQGFVFNCALVANQAFSGGGGANGGTIRNSLLAYNVASSGGGASMPVLLEHCLVYANVATSTFAGGVHGGTTRDCTITGNRAFLHGGGVYAGTYYQTVISSNQAGQSGGGGFSAAFWNCDIIGNESTYEGGGLYQSYGYNCLIQGNRGSQGGGAYCYDFNKALYNCTVVENTSSDWGGGLYGVYAQNSIVYFNHASQYSNYYGAAFLASCMAPLVVGNGNRSEDPLFANAAGGDYRLTGPSLCVDAGTNLSLMGIGQDRDGISRPLDGNNDGVKAWDMGAYEYVHPDADSDADRVRDAEEIVAGTDPTNAFSFLQVTDFPTPPSEASGLVVRWASVAGKLYSVDRATNMMEDPAFTSWMSGVAGLPNYTTVTDAQATVNGPYFYRVGISP